MSDASALQPGLIRLEGNLYMPNGQGIPVPIEMVKDEHRLQDGVVRDLFGQAEVVHETLATFMASARGQVRAFLDLVVEKYGAKARPGGDKGNVTLQSYDGLLKVQVQVADLIRFDSAALQACQLLVEECIAEWSSDSQAELRAIVMNAFRLDKAGQINRGALLGLLRLNITDERWVRAMQALRDSMQVDGSKDYLRFHERENLKAPWRSLSLDAATV